MKIKILTIALAVAALAFGGVALAGQGAAKADQVKCDTGNASGFVVSNANAKGKLHVVVSLKGDENEVEHYIVTVPGAPGEGGVLMPNKKGNGNWSGSLDISSWGDDDEDGFYSVTVNLEDEDGNCYYTSTLDVPVK